MIRPPNAANTPLSMGGGVLETVILLKSQRSRIDAKTQTGRRRPILKHVSLVGAAQSAFNLHPLHAAAVVRLGHEILLGHRLEKTWPAGAGIKFRLRRKQRQSATDARVNARLMLIIKGAAEGWLRALGAR